MTTFKIFTVTAVNHMTRKKEVLVKNNNRVKS